MKEKAKRKREKERERERHTVANIVGHLKIKRII